MAKIQV